MICCSYCLAPSTERYAYRLSEIGERPSTFACAQCGGAEGQPSEILRLASVMDELNHATVRLNRKEISHCLAVAKRRNFASFNRENLKVSARSDLWIHILGACGEAAVCKFLRVPYSGSVNTFRASDLPFNIEVRTRSAPWHDLKIRPDDDDRRRVVMAVCRSIDKPIRLVGWIGAKSGKEIGPLIDPSGAQKPFHAVPQEMLRPMSELKKLFDKHRLRGVEVKT